MSRPIRGQGGNRAAILDFRIGTQSNNTFRGPHIEHLYQVWPIRGYGGHLEFPICAKSNHTCSEPRKEHLYQVSSQSLHENENSQLLKVSF